jgi:hypothetical protein
MVSSFSLFLKASTCAPEWVIRGFYRRDPQIATSSRRFPRRVFLSCGAVAVQRDQRGNAAPERRAMPSLAL